MSFDINWETLANDHELNNSIFHSLNNYLNSIILPSYIKNLRLENLSLGKKAPIVTLRQITEPLNDFYEAVQDEMGPDLKLEKSPNDTQLLTEIEFQGDMSLTIYAEMVLNYPSTEFMALPVKITVSNLGFHSLCIIAYLSKQVFFSFLCDIDNESLDKEDIGSDSNVFNIATKKPLERISIIRSLSLETEVGEKHQKEGSILKSIGKLELFLSDKLKEYLTKEVAWPSWINLDFNEEETDNYSSSNDEL